MEVENIEKCPRGCAPGTCTRGTQVPVNKSQLKRQNDDLTARLEEKTGEIDELREQNDELKAINEGLAVNLVNVRLTLAGVKKALGLFPSTDVNASVIPDMERPSHEDQAV